MKGLPEEWLKALGPGVSFADADQYSCAVKRWPPERWKGLCFKPVDGAPWLMRAWVVHYGGYEQDDYGQHHKLEPDFTQSITVDRKGEVSIGEAVLAEWEL